MYSLVQEAQECLSANGGRMTAERRIILETLESSSGHPTADELYELIKPHHPDLNLSTVYRTLRWLEQQGLVGSHRFAEDRGQERFDPSLPTQHDHFVCTVCKRVIEFSSPLVYAIQRQFETDFDAQVETASMVLYGLCEDCR
jgi:Fe2+ or Zn2+ uptake regulation protein